MIRQRLATSESSVPAERPQPPADAAASARHKARTFQEQATPSAAVPTHLPGGSSTRAMDGDRLRASAASVSRRQEVEQEIAAVLAAERERKFVDLSSSDAPKLRAGKEQAG